MTQPLVWVAVKLCEVIVFVVDTGETIVETVKATAKGIVELTREIVQRVRKNEVVQNICEGIKTVKELTDVPETLHTTWRILFWLWTFAMGLACSSSVAAPWAAASNASCVAGVMYFAMLVGTSLFALFLIRRLARPFRMG